MSTPYERLRTFIEKKMRMSHVYQPVMLHTLLRNGGSATIREISSAVLSHDESQIEYYEQIVKHMPGRVLAAHGIVAREGHRYRLANTHLPQTPAERRDLLRCCRTAADTFKERRGSEIWEHRRPGLAVIPGVYPGFPTLFWGLSGFFVNDLMGKALWSSWKTRSVFQGAVGAFCASTAPSASTGPICMRQDRRVLGLQSTRE